MILDGTLLFETATAITATRVSTNIVDLGVARDLGNDAHMKVLTVVTTAFLSTGSSTLQCAFQGSTDNSTWSTYAEGPAVAKASLIAGATGVLPINLPQPATGLALPRYIRLNWTVGVADFTAGAITATLVLDKQSNYAYPPGIAIAN